MSISQQYHPQNGTQNWGNNVGVPVHTVGPDGTPIIIVPIAVPVPVSTSSNSLGEQVVSGQQNTQIPQPVYVGVPNTIKEEPSLLSQEEPEILQEDLAGEEKEGQEELYRPEAEASFKDTGKNTSFEKFKRNFGGGGFLFSLIFHFVLILIAFFWVISSWVTTTDLTPDAFITGAGGGNNGNEAKIQEHRMKPKNAREMVKSANRIASKSATATLALPDMPMASMSFFDSGMKAGGDSSGFGGGSGGGIGTGQGIGVGNGRNFVGKFVMGAELFASKLAVYLDCSGSMTPYLPRVKKEIYDKFPDADIFEFNAIITQVIDGEVCGGKKYKGPKGPRGRTPYGAIVDGTNPDKLSPQGKKIYKRYAANFAEGSVGAWIDIMRDENYDALVIFSDFQDGLAQYSKERTPLFIDSRYRPTEGDLRKKKDLIWEQNWQKSFSKTNAPRLYLFSIEQDPQLFLANCVKLSKGKVTMVQYLRNEELPDSTTDATSSNNNQNSEEDSSQSTSRDASENSYDEVNKSGKRSGKTRSSRSSTKSFL